MLLLGKKTKRKTLFFIIFWKSSFSWCGWSRFVCVCVCVSSDIQYKKSMWRSECYLLLCLHSWYVCVCTVGLHQCVYVQTVCVCVCMSVTFCLCVFFFCICTNMNNCFVLLICLTCSAWKHKLALLALMHQALWSRSSDDITSFTVVERGGGHSQPIGTVQGNNWGLSVSSRAFHCCAHMRADEPRATGQTCPGHIAP